MKSRIKRITSTKGFALLLLTIVLAIAFYLIKHTWVAKLNIRTLMNDLCVILVIMCGVVPLLIGGGVNMGASAEAAIGSVIFAKLLEIPGMPWAVGLIVALLAGAVMGLLLIYLGKAFSLMPFIVSFGFSNVYTGAASLWTRANNVMINNTSFLAIGKKAFFGGYVPALFIFALVLVIIYWLLMKYTNFGRSCYLVGGNPTAARLAGINGGKIQTILFVNASVLHVLSGIVWACQKKMGSPTKIQVLSPNFDALSAAVLGGVAFSGGSGSIGSAFFGVIMVQVFTNGVIHLGLPTHWSTMLQGLVLIVALMLDHYNAVRAERARKKAAMAGVKKAA